MFDKKDNFEKMISRELTITCKPFTQKSDGAISNLKKDLIGKNKECIARPGRPYVIMYVLNVPSGA